jgi:hypothetical protein
MRDGDRERAAQRVTSQVSQVPPLLALQRTAGNRAVAAMVAAGRGHSRQLARKPEDWAAKQAVKDVLALKRGGNIF